MFEELEQMYLERFQLQKAREAVMLLSTCVRVQPDTG